jgi:hypothetical protein
MDCRSATLVARLPISWQGKSSYVEKFAPDTPSHTFIQLFQSVGTGLWAGTWPLGVSFGIPGALQPASHSADESVGKFMGKGKEP